MRDKKNLCIMKAIIAIQGQSAKGKSASILHLEERLAEKGVIYQKEGEEWGDKLLIVGYTPEGCSQEFIIGCCSQGDPCSKQNEWLERCREKNCDIIVVACRTRGETVQNIERVAWQSNCPIIYCSTYQYTPHGQNKDENTFHFLNGLFVQHLLNLIVEILKRPQL